MISRKELIEGHTEQLEEIYKQRRYWLYASSVVYSVIILLIFGWDYIDTTSHGTNIWWVIVSLSLLISVNWWYWTMKSLSTLVRCIYTEYTLLSEVTDEIEAVKVILQCKSTLDGTKCDECPISGKCKDS